MDVTDWILKNLHFKKQKRTTTTAPLPLRYGCSGGTVVSHTLLSPSMLVSMETTSNGLYISRGGGGKQGAPFEKERALKESNPLRRRSTLESLQELC